VIQHIVRRLAAGGTPGLLSLLAGSTLPAQAPAELAGERAQYHRWLLTSTVSPLRAMSQMPVGSGIRLGPADADIPIPDLPEHRLRPQGGAFVLEAREGKRVLGRHRPFKVGGYTLYLTSTPDGAIVTVYGGSSDKQPPGYYTYDSSLVFVATLTPPDEAGKVRVLGPDGIQREGTEAGSVLVPLAGGTHLRVLRLPGAREEESELEIFFRDETNGKGSYPAGRFVSLVPAGGGTYRLDFNRARNPFCAYSSAYACPAPWPGNALRVPVRAGEQYHENPEVG
jgi:hypothetical protein